MSSKVGLVVLSVILFPVVLWMGWLLGQLWLVGRLRLRWPSDKFVLIAYTDSEVWAPYIENVLLPQIGQSCVVINRSRSDGKRQYPSEKAAISFWGGLWNYNPLAVVLRPWGRPRVFRLYHPFLEMKHGRPAALEAEVKALKQCVQDAGLPYDHR